MGLKVAVVGATGNVGREMLNILDELKLPVEKVAAVASRRSIGREVSFGDKTLKCQALENFDFTGYDIALMSAGGSVSKEWSPKIAAQGCVVIDNSSQWRMDPDVPLVVPEVNPDAVEGFKKKGIIANPNCSTIQMVVALKPLHDKAKIKRIVVATYQSTSGKGKEAMDELWTQTRAIFVNDEVKVENFTKQIAFNCIPHIDVFMDDDDANDSVAGETKEEWKMKVETKKIMDKGIEVSATCVRVPTFVGHGESVNVEFEAPISDKEAMEILSDAPGVVLFDRRDDGGYTSIIECVGEHATFVSRLRKDPTVKNGLAMWIVSDNLRKGAALNAVQIAQLMLDKGLIGKR